MHRRFISQFIIGVLYLFVFVVVISVIYDLVRMWREKRLPKSRAEKILLAASIVGTFVFPITLCIGTIAPGWFAEFRYRISHKK